MSQILPDTVESNKLDQWLWEDFRVSLAGYEQLTAQLRAQRDDVARVERRIGLLAALIAVDGGTVKLPDHLDPAIEERLSMLLGRRRINWATRR